MPKLNPKPTSGWNCREVLDAKSVAPDEPVRCEFCSTRIRWIHVLDHEDFPRHVEAGCCCASRLCLDYDAEAAEREVKNRMGRRLRFVDRKRWSRSRINPTNIWRWARLPDGQRVRVTVFQNDGTYGIYFADKKDRSDTYCHPNRYSTADEAINVAFELIDQA